MSLSLALCTVSLLSSSLLPSLTLTEMQKGRERNHLRLPSADCSTGTENAQAPAPRSHVLRPRAAQSIVGGTEAARGKQSLRCGARTSPRSTSWFYNFSSLGKNSWLSTACVGSSLEGILQQRGR